MRRHHGAACLLNQAGDGAFHKGDPSEAALATALCEIGVVLRRPDPDTRLDVPDLFRVAARLLKRGGTAPG